MKDDRRIIDIISDMATRAGAIRDILKAESEGSRLDIDHGILELLADDIHRDAEALAIHLPNDIEARLEAGEARQ